MADTTERLGVTSRSEVVTRAVPRRRARFSIAVGSIVGLGIAFRLIWVLANRGRAPATDAYFYTLNADFLSRGQGIYASTGSGPSAFHPPGWPAVLSVVPVAGFSSVLAYQVLGCIVGGVTVLLVALAGREIAGARVGIIAAALAAVSPNIWIWERQIAAETLVLPLVAGTVLLAYRFLAEPRLVTAAGLGALSAVLGLTRGEQALVFVFVVIPLVVVRERTNPRRAAILILGAGVATLIVFAPWFVYNANRFDRRVLISTNFGPTIRLSNNDYSYYGSGIGSYDRSLWAKPVPVPGRDESVQDEAGTRIGRDYARDHLGRLPIVLMAREGRTWGFFAVAQQARIDEDWGKDPIWVFWAGIVANWLLLPAAVVGAVVLRRRGQFLFPLLAPLVVAALAAAVTFGQPRLRAGAEVALVLLAAVAIDAGLRRLRQSASVAARQADVIAR